MPYKLLEMSSWMFLTVKDRIILTFGEEMS